MACDQRFQAACSNRSFPMVGRPRSHQTGVRAGLCGTGGGDCGGGGGVAVKALTGPGLCGGPVEVGTHAGHGVADSAGRGRARHGGKQDEPAHPAEADLRQIDDEIGRSGVQRRDEGGADEGSVSMSMSPAMCSTAMLPVGPVSMSSWWHHMAADSGSCSVACACARGAGSAIRVSCASSVDMTGPPISIAESRLSPVG